MSIAPDHVNETEVPSGGVATNVVGADGGVVSRVAGVVAETGGVE